MKLYTDTAIRQISSKKFTPVLRKDDPKLIFFIKTRRIESF